MVNLEVMLEDLAQITKSLVAPQKGVLAADESTGTIEKRFGAINLTSTPELNRRYRKMLVTTPEIEEFLGGVILFDETAKQEVGDGVSFPKYLISRGIIPGIKVDEGREPFNEEEEITKGLNGLDERLKTYKEMGLGFTKWRAAIKITRIYPSEELVWESAKRLAKFASISQENGFVPIVEPEVLMDGEHTTARCEEITTKTLKTLFSEIQKEEVSLKGLLLKVNMVLPGKESGVKASPNEVAGATLRTLKSSVPEGIAGVVFLSGGQTPEEATLNLNEIEKGSDLPFPLSFSFARALQGEALEAWMGSEENVKEAQEIFLERLKKVSLARQGKYI